MKMLENVGRHDYIDESFQLQFNEKQKTGFSGCCGEFLIGLLTWIFSARLWD